jgi:polyhydroxyalkanoate synthesis regulator phasin
LSEVEHSASRLKDYSGQLESASHDALNELHRRLENILEAQTDEMRQRVDRLASEAHDRLRPELDFLGQQLAERTIADLQSRVAPHVERVPELLRELSARELQADTSLRLYRERLRQVTDNNHNEASAQLASTLADLRNDFESARREALAKWTEELDAGGVRASHAAAESIGRSSEWFQQEARARMQVLAEQTLATATSTFDEKTAEAARQFEAKLEEQTAGRVAQIQQQLDHVTNELSGRAQGEIAAAAEAAAASFGQVLRGISEQESAQFTRTSRTILGERQQEFEQFTAGAMQNLEANAAASVDRFHAQMASQVQASVGEGRNALASEFASMVEGFRSDRETYKNEWAAGLDQLSVDAVAKHQERLQATSDSWVVSAVRRLNEHGQTAVESLIRSADQSLRDSCSKVFEDLAEMLRRTTSIADAVGYAPPPGYNPSESAPHQHSASGD